MNKILNILLILLVAGYIAYHFYKKPKYINGELAPIFTATMLDGSSFSLDDMKGKYVLLDFWGSWCGPCRRENPSLVSLYKAYHGKKYKDAVDFEIVSVAIESDDMRMKKAIANDKLIWPHHIPQLDRFESPIVKMYGVKEIPTKYMINPEGYIMGVNQSVEEIDKLLRVRLK